MVSPQQQRLMDAATKAGIAVEDLSAAWSQDAVLYSLNGSTEVVFEGAMLGSSSYLGATICQDLPITRTYAKQFGIPTPDSIVFKLETENVSQAQLKEIVGGFWVQGERYACIPAFSTDGHGASMQLTDLTDLELHLDNYVSEYATWVLERQKEGQDFQVLVVGGQVVAGIVRSALRLAGDGIRTLEELIDTYNETAPEAEKVTIDGETRQLLREQNIFLSEVVPVGVRVQVKNPGAGGSGSKDETAAMHATYHKWGTTIAKATGLKVLSMNFKCDSVGSDPQAQAQLLSLSAKPDWLVFEQAEGNSKDIAKLMLKAMFPENPF